MTEQEKKSAAEAMMEIQEILKRYNCQFDIIVAWSSFQGGPSFTIRAVPKPTELVIAHDIPTTLRSN